MYSRCFDKNFILSYSPRVSVGLRRFQIRNYFPTCRKIDRRLTSPIMADFAVGTWNLESTENFDEYMKTIGVGMVMRKMGATAKPTQIITITDGTWNVKTETTLKKTEITFKIGEEFDEATADGRNVKTTMTLEGQKLTATQKGDIPSTITREWAGDTMNMLLEAKGVVCKRVYKKAS